MPPIGLNLIILTKNKISEFTYRHIIIFISATMIKKHQKFNLFLILEVLIQENENRIFYS